MGLIGLGNRGMQLLEEVFSQHPEVEIAAVCDVYEDRVQRAIHLLTEKGCPEPVAATDYKTVLDMPDVEAVILSTSWDHHIDLCI